METDAYKLLGIPPDAGNDEIRKAFRIKSLKTHPDVNDSMDAALQFMKLQEAMETLLDPVRRLQHDRQFGYYTKVPNKDSNAKQEYSDFQKEKAGRLVNSWNTDYEKAMAMREQQRQRVVERNKRRLRLIIILIITIACIAAGMVCYMLGK